MTHIFNYFVLFCLIHMVRWLFLSLLVIAFDQFTKWLIDKSIALYDSVPLLPFFQLTYLRNEGAAFSLLAGAGGWQRWFFVGLAVAASAFIYFQLYYLKKHQRWEATAWALVLGGAIGNVVDRIAYGYVIDFLDVYYQSWHWPAFNVADSAITIGVGILLALSFWPEQDGP